MKKSLSLIAFLFSIILIFCGNAAAQNIDVSVIPEKVKAGDTVRISVSASSSVSPSAVILIPQKGTIPLKLESENSISYTSEFVVKNEDPGGLYAVHVWTGDEANPSSVGKGSFLYKKIVGDFCVLRIFDQENLIGDLNKYLKEFEGFGGNLLIAHGIITPTKVYYNSDICKMGNTSEIERTYLETLLSRADEEGISVLLSVSWDMTRDIHTKYRTENTKKILEELYKKFSHHPSMVGFYTYQEGSGIYLVPFVREFTGYSKSLNEGLLTACAPYMDDPLLAGYLSTVKNLDIIIYQSMVMASYRPDNRKEFPLRRVNDFGRVSVGAKKLQDKIALTHIETFGYLENRLKELYITDYNNIFMQILSAAAVADNDGITFFTFSNVIYDLIEEYPQYKEAFEPSKQAVLDGMKAFQIIGKASREPNQLMIYFPWADWVTERWAVNYYDAFDAFRILGIPVDFLPYAPPLDESYLPYYPYKENPEVLERLVQKKKILIFPNVSGFNKTDSELMKKYIDSGGVAIAFGTQIPMGTTYDRKELFGIEEISDSKVHTKILCKNKIGTRISEGDQFELNNVKIPVWKSTGAKVTAVFEDGTPAAVVNQYGEGRTYSILVDAKTAANDFPALVRDIIDDALSFVDGKRAVDIKGANSKTDFAITKTKNGFIAALINHNETALNLILKSLISVPENETILWKDYVKGAVINNLKGKSEINIELLPNSFRVIEFEY